MDEELKEKWLKALRSGDYKQGRNALKTVTNRFCCLGVLADIVNPKGWQKDGLEPNKYSWARPKSTSFLPLNLISTDIQVQLVNMNDSDGKSFTSIADWIEKNV